MLENDEIQVILGHFGLAFQSVTNLSSKTQP